MIVQRPVDGPWTYFALEDFHERYNPRHGIADRLAYSLCLYDAPLFYAENPPVIRNRWPKTGCARASTNAWQYEKLFQSSSGPKAGCAPHVTRAIARISRGFNPHPARRQDAPVLLIFGAEADLSTRRARTWHVGVLLVIWLYCFSGQIWLRHATFRPARTFG